MSGKHSLHPPSAGSSSCKNRDTENSQCFFSFTLSSLSESWMCSLSKVTLALNFVGYNYDGAVS